MRHVVSQIHMLVRSMGLSRLLARTEEAEVVDCDLRCKLDDKDVSPLLVENDQLASVDLAKIPIALAKLNAATDAIAERVSGLAEHCRALAAGQVLNYQTAQEVSDNCKQDIDRVTQRMSAFGHEISKAVQDIGETNVQQMCNVSKDMTALGQELMARLGQLETDVVELRALRKLDVEHADETDRWLVRHHDLIQKQSDRFSVTIDALLQNPAGKSSPNYAADSDIRVGSLKARLQKCQGGRNCSGGVKTATGTPPSCHKSSLNSLTCSTNASTPVKIAEHYFIGDEEASSATKGTPQSSNGATPQSSGQPTPASSSRPTPASSSWATPQSSSRITLQQRSRTPPQSSSAKRAEASSICSRKESQVDVGTEGNVKKHAAPNLQQVHPPASGVSMANFLKSRRCTQTPSNHADAQADSHNPSDHLVDREAE